MEIFGKLRARYRTDPDKHETAVIWVLARQDAIERVDKAGEAAFHALGEEDYDRLNAEIRECEKVWRDKL